MPLTIFDTKGIHGHRRERIEARSSQAESTPRARMRRGSQPMCLQAALEHSLPGRRDLSASRTFALDDDPTVIAERVRNSPEPRV
jgi:hypothetical protein